MSKILQIRSAGYVVWDDIVFSPDMPPSSPRTLEHRQG